MKSCEKKLLEAKTKLIIKNPYLGTLASGLKIEVSDTIEAFKSDGLTLYYNDDYLFSLESLELEFVLANGALHAALIHEQRKAKRASWLWQMASDLAINSLLVANGFTLAPKSSYQKRFDGLYTEEIYAQLKDELLRNDELEYEAQEEDEVESENKESSERELKELQEELFAHKAQNLLEQEIQRDGEFLEGIERFFSLSYRSNIDWRELLKNAIEPFIYDNYALIPPSKKLLYAGIYLPSSVSQTYRFVVAIDSSGSIDEELLGIFLSELEFVMQVLPSYEIELLVADDRVRSCQTFTKGERLQYTLKGGGGTNFSPVFEYIAENFSTVHLLFYFTDLDGVFPKEPPHYSVKWIAPKEKEIPFGDLILLD